MVFKRFQTKIIVIIGLLFILFASCAPNNYTIVSPFKKLSPAVRCVGIYPFKNLTTTSKAGLVVSQIFYDELAKRSGWSVINWDTLLRISESTDDKLPPGPTNLQLAKYGRKLKLGAILYGNVLDYRYRVTGNGVIVPVVSFSAKLIDTGTGRIVWTGLASVVGGLNIDSLTSLLRKIVDGMILDIERRSGKANVRCEASKAVWALLEKISPETGKKKQEKSLSPEASTIYNMILTRKKFILEGLRFKGRTVTLEPGANKILDALGEVLRAYPEIRLKIEVHTDASGNAAVDKNLTLQQAKFLFQYLITKFHISPNRIEYQSMGSDYPLLPNISRRNRELNRRVEVVVLTR